MKYRVGRELKEMLLFIVNVLLVGCFVVTFTLWRSFTQKSVITGFCVRLGIISVAAIMSGYHFLTVISSTTEFALLATLVVGSVGIAVDVLKMFNLSDANIRKRAV